MDKLIHVGGKATITNDGATIIKLLDIVHPAAKVLSDIATSQDNEVGDGTTSVVLFAGELLREAHNFVDEGMHSRVIINAYRKASVLACDKLRELEFDASGSNPEERRTNLIRLAKTSLNSKLVSSYKEFFGAMIVDAVLRLDAELDRTLVGIKHVAGGSVTNSFLVDGVAFKKTFSYAGFEQQPKSFTSPKILLLNVELEHRSEKENAEIRISNPEDYQSIIDAEWNIIYNKLERIVETGAQIILSKLPIGDLATQYFADRSLFCAGRVPQEDMLRVAKATGATILSTTHEMPASALGECGDFEEVQIGGERYNLFKQCKKAQSATIILRGSAEQYIDETERSLNDAIMVVRRAVKSPKVVGGAGAVEMELSKYLREYSRNITGKQQHVINSFARALEVIPKTLAANAGFDSVEVLNQLRKAHATGDDGRWAGVNVVSGGTLDAVAEFIWEPALLKLSVLSAATEAACVVLSVDETVRHPKNEEPQAKPVRGRGRGRRPY
jgi:T-complex protein 1 subunit eta